MGALAHVRTLHSRHTIVSNRNLKIAAGPKSPAALSKMQKIKIPTILPILFLSACGGDDSPGGKGAISQALAACESVVNWEIWVPRPTNNDLQLVSGTRLQIDAEIELASTGLSNPRDVTFSADALFAYVGFGGTDAASSGAGIASIDVIARQVRGQAPMNRPIGLVAYGPDNQIWAADSSNGAIVLINPQTLTETSSISLSAAGTPVDLFFSTNGQQAFLLLSNGTLVQISVSGRNETARSSISSSGTAAALLGDGDILMVDGTEGTLFRVDPTTLTATTSASNLQGTTDVAVGEGIFAPIPNTSVLAGLDEMANRCDIAVPITGAITVSPDCQRLYVLNSERIIMLRNNEVIRDIALAGGGERMGIVEVPSGM